MTSTQHTPGPAKISHSYDPATRKIGMFIDPEDALQNDEQGICKMYGPDKEANATLICEAFNVTHETGMTPRELAENLQASDEACRITRLEKETAQALSAELLALLQEAHAALLGQYKENLPSRIRGAIAKAQAR